jgi:two-component system, chemotaxis family, protein-glutamate methylesterase/glutaminase
MRVLVVDDARLVRRVIADTVTAAGHEVVGEAGDGHDALRQARDTRPDLITLDIEMPGPNGIDVLRRVMASHPTKVVLVSSLTTAGADVTLEGLGLGAIDFVAKPSSASGLDEFRSRLEDTLAAVAAARLSPVPARSTGPSRPARSPGSLRRPSLMVVASSTGGPTALARFFGAFHAAPSMPVLVVQHMPAHFTARLADRLDRTLPFPVCEASDSRPTRSGTVMIAPGDHHLGYRGGRVRLLDSPPIGRLRPAADVTLREVADSAIAAGTLVVVLTGMGKDGLEGARLIAAAGGQVVAQDADSSAVDGMPRAVREAGLARISGSPEHLASLVETASRRGAA